MASLTLVPDVGEHRPDSFLHLLFLTFTFWSSLLLQPQGHEQVEPPPRHLMGIMRRFRAGASRALKGHLLQQRGQVPAPTPRISPCGHTALVLSGDSLIFPWLWTPQRSLWQRPLSALGVAFCPPGKPKWIHEIKSHCQAAFSATAAPTYSCCNSHKHCDCRVGAARWIGHVKRPPESVGYELEGWGRWGRALALRSFPFLARVCLGLICFGLCVYLIRHQRTGKNAGQHNAELTGLISVTVFWTSEWYHRRRKDGDKARTTSCVSSVFSRMTDGAAFIKSIRSFLVLTRPLVDSSEASAASQSRSFSLAETDSINRFLGDDALQPTLRFQGPSDVLEMFWQNEKVQETSVKKEAE